MRRGDEDRAYEPSYPTRDPDPVPVRPMNPDCCGNCPGWQRQHPRAPFGQCLPAIRFLGAPMYTPDLGGCTMPLEDKTRALKALGK